MGGGVSSPSKVCVIGPSAREDEDVDFSFGLVLIKEARVGCKADGCNMSAAVGR